jgi:hypothetical protein
VFARCRANAKRGSGPARYYFALDISLSATILIRCSWKPFRSVLDIHLQTDGNRLDALPDLPDLHHTVFLDISAQELGDASILST